MDFEEDRTLLVSAGPAGVDNADQIRGRIMVKLHRATWTRTPGSRQTLRLAVAGVLLVTTLVFAVVSAARGSRLLMGQGLVTEAENMVNSSRPSLFCWSHMLAGGYEEPLIKMQLVRRASIFACDEYAVISTDKIQIGDIWGAGVYTWVNEAPEVPMGQNGVAGQTTDSFLNTEIFLLAWDTLIHSGKLWKHDFVVKVDPDAVFFPDRLRRHVAKHKGTPVYFPNCGKWEHALLYGALEVLSAEALHIYEAHVKECKALPWHGWGEDYYMQHCLDQLGVTAVIDRDQVADERCLGAPCSDWTKVAFHDFKDPEDWHNCFQMAIGEAKPSDDRVEIFFRKRKLL